MLTYLKIWINRHSFERSNYVKSPCSRIDHFSFGAVPERTQQTKYKSNSKLTYETERK